MSADKKRILICGNYGASNLGDEAILGGLVTLVKSTFPNAVISVMSSSIKSTEKFFEVNAISHFPAGLRSFFKFWFSKKAFNTLAAVKSADLVLIGGGGLFTDEKPQAVWIWTVQTFWFWLFRKPIFSIAQSVGPLNTKVGKVLTRWSFRRAKKITVRDKQSQQLLEKLGRIKSEVLADPAYAIGYGTASFHNKQKQVVITARKWEQEIDLLKSEELAKFIDWAFEEHQLDFVFLPFQTNFENDQERFEQIRSLLKNKNALNLRVPQDYSEALEIINRSSLVIGMRLHSIIFAVLARCPFIAISYSKKVRDFTETIGLANYSLDYRELKFVDLKLHLSDILANNKKIVNLLEKAKLSNTYEYFKHEKILQYFFSK